MISRAYYKRALYKRPHQNVLEKNKNKISTLILLKLLMKILIHSKSKNIVLMFGEFLDSFCLNLYKKRNYRSVTNYLLPINGVVVLPPVLALGTSPAKLFEGWEYRIRTREL